MALPPSAHSPEASPRAISGRTSYNPARLEFHHEPRLIRGLFNERRFGPPEGFAPLSSWPWLDRRVSGLPVPTRALFGLGFPAAPRLPLSLAGIDNSQAHSSIGTTSGFDALGPVAGMRFQDLFIPLPGFFSPFPHGTMRYRSISVFRLGGWSPQLPTGFLVSHGTPDPAPCIRLRLRGSHSLWLSFPAHSASLMHLIAVHNPGLVSHPGLGSAPFARRY